MNELMLAREESNNQEIFGCPFATTSRQKTLLDADDELVLPQYKRVITQYSTDASGVTELHLYYGEKEISFDDPELFAFGEGIAKQARFVAGTATTWSKGYDWPKVQELLEQLIDEGILQRADANQPDAVASHGGTSPALLPEAHSIVPRTWFECEEITRELTGYPLELGYLELVIPIFRVAHIALDTDGRQIGEANVFPAPLRLDVPTEWRTCLYAGSRYQADRPMNVTALKSMRDHWPQMMAALFCIRAAFLNRFPKARDGWTVGDLERLSSLVLAIPAYLLMRTQERVETGDLHPVISSLFRVTDGLRMTMHQMLFLPMGEQSRPPDAPMTSAEVYAYAERNYVFFSDHGVCAGPKAMIEEFLGVLMDGHSVKSTESVMFDPPVQAALDDLDSAFDYGLYGLQVHAVVFSLWPAMSRAYTQLWTILETWSGEQSDTFTVFRERFQNNMKFLSGSLLAIEEWRISRERAYANMYEHCADGLGTTFSAATLPERIAPVAVAHDVAGQLSAILRQRFCMAAVTDSPEIDSLVAGLMDYFCREQAIVRAACEIQQRINHILGRTPPTRPFPASTIDLYNQMQGNASRIPYLVHEIEEALGLRIVVTQDAIDIFDRALN